MQKIDLSYSIVQYSPRPDRFEFVNVGVLVFDERLKRIVSKLSSDFSRVRKFFGEVSPSYLKLALEDFSDRVEYEFRAAEFKISSEMFNSKRVGLFQITPVLPISGKNASEVAANLFSELVETDAKRVKTQRVSTLLTNAFKNAGVLPLLERRPKAVRIAKWGVSVKADYGYQNGVFNLIDSARFEDSERGLAEAGKRVLEGRALADTLDHRLVVVGDFGEQPNSFVNSLKHEFAEANAKLFTLDEIDLLAAEIRRSVH